MYPSGESLLSFKESLDPRVVLEVGFVAFRISAYVDSMLKEEYVRDYKLLCRHVLTNSQCQTYVVLNWTVASDGSADCQSLCKCIKQYECKYILKKNTTCQLKYLDIPSSLILSTKVLPRWSSGWATGHWRKGFGVSMLRSPIKIIEHVFLRLLQIARLVSNSGS